MNTNRFVLSAFLSWLLFLSLDFLAHASVLRSFWAQELAALKPQRDLFRLIPAGYMSFLLLTLLVGWLYVSFHKDNGNAIRGMTFGAVFGGIYALALFLGWYSFLNLPILFLFLMGVVYFVEIVGVGFCFGYLMAAESLRKRVWPLIVVIFCIFVVGILLQNL
ncbi:MAG: hypothetical protein PVF22_04870 [Candidatus Aminicenantes bacterium]|jgi:hypothetical protein